MDLKNTIMSLIRNGALTASELSMILTGSPVPSHEICSTLEVLLETGKVAKNGATYTLGSRTIIETWNSKDDIANRFSSLVKMNGADLATKLSFAVEIYELYANNDPNSTLYYSQLALMVGTTSDIVKQYYDNHKPPVGYYKGEYSLKRTRMFDPDIDSLNKRLNTTLSLSLGLTL